MPCALWRRKNSQSSLNFQLERRATFWIRLKSRHRLNADSGFSKNLGLLLLDASEREPLFLQESGGKRKVKLPKDGASACTKIDL